MQEEEPTALLRVAVVFKIHLERSEQIGSILVIVALDDIESRMKQTVKRNVALDGVYEYVKRISGRTVPSDFQIVIDEYFRLFNTRCQNRPPNSN